MPNPKVQRGVSLAPDLYASISAEADKYGRTWNETVELVLRKAFLSDAPDMHDKHEKRIAQHDEGFIHDDYDD